VLAGSVRSDFRRSRSTRRRCGVRSTHSTPLRVRVCAGSCSSNPMSRASSRSRRRSARRRTTYQGSVAVSKQMSEAIMTAANNGDQFAIELFADAGYKIGKALAILIHIMNPQAIVLSGRGAKVGKILLAPIQQALHKYCIPRLSRGTELLISELGFDAELIGASVLVMENFDKEVKSQGISV